MSKARGLVPMAIATVIGIGTGIAIFDPAFKEEKLQKEQESTMDFKEQHSPSPEEQIHATEVAVANAGGATTIPKDATRWGEIQANQYSKPANVYSWSEVPLNQYTHPGKSS